MLGLMLVAILLAVAWPSADFWPVLAGALVGLLAIDAWLLWRTPLPLVHRQVPHILAVRREHEVRLELANPFDAPLAVEVVDEFPASFEGSRAPQRLEVGAGQTLLWGYGIVPLARGPARFERVRAARRSPFALWRLERRVGDASDVQIYPDYTVIADYLNLLADQNSQQLGLKQHQRRGEGLEFHQLREFRDGDSVRQVDWKATARRRSLISREYAEERDQNVVFLLDTGGRMRAADGARNHFDHALDALLLLSYVALKQGDRVAVQTFGPTDRWIARLRGTNAVNRLLNELYDLHSLPGAGDFVAAAETLLSRQRKRALVVVLSNLRHSDADLLPAVHLLRRRHAVMIANLREGGLDAAMRQPVQRFDDALTVLGASRVLMQRRDLLRRLTGSAQMVLDCRPAELPIQLVNGYWALKRAGTL